MKIITVITDSDNYGFRNLLYPSAKLYNLDLVVLLNKQYNSHRCKDHMLYEYLKSVDEQEVIFFTDGYDTMFLASEEEILNKFYKIDKELLFSAEITCWPDSSLSQMYPSTGSPFKYLNSGGFIGTARSIKRCLEDNLQSDLVEKYNWSNQIYWTEQYLKNSSWIGLDTGCEIFCTLSSHIDADIGKEHIENTTRTKMDSSVIFEVAESEQKTNDKDDRRFGKYTWEEYNTMKQKWFSRNFLLRDNRLFIKATRNYCCHLHFNGGSKVLVNSIMEKLQLKLF
jgi:hypothetical protein